MDNWLPFVNRLKELSQSADGQVIVALITLFVVSVPIGAMWPAALIVSVIYPCYTALQLRRLIHTERMDLLSIQRREMEHEQQLNKQGGAKRKAKAATPKLEGSS